MNDAYTHARSEDTGCAALTQAATQVLKHCKCIECVRRVDTPAWCLARGVNTAQIGARADPRSVDRRRGCVGGAAAGTEHGA